MNKLISIIALIVAVVAIGISISDNTKPIPNVGGLVNIGQRDFPDGISVDGTEIISGTGGASFTTGTFSTSLSVGSGTSLTKAVCISTTTDWASMNAGQCAWGTTTMTGITASGSGSTGWSFFVSPIATTSGIETTANQMALSAIASSTNVVQIKVCNNATNTAVNLPVQYYEVCGIKH